METKKCSKCQGEMENGLIVDRGDLIKTQSQWATSVTMVVGLKNAHDINTFRCIKCGFLESYAK